MLRLRPPASLPSRLRDRDEDRDVDARHSPHVVPQLGDPAIGPTGNCETVTDWIKLAALSLLISTAITAVLGTVGFALWWLLVR